MAKPRRAREDFGEQCKLQTGSRHMVADFSLIVAVAIQIPAKTARKPTTTFKTSVRPTRRRRQLPAFCTRVSSDHARSRC